MRYSKLPLLLLGALVFVALPLAAQDRPTAVGLVKQGRVFESQKELDKALEAYRQAIAADADFADAYVGLGSVLNNLRRAKEALEPYTTAIRLSPKNVQAYAGLGAVYMNLHRTSEAIDTFNEGIKVDPKESRLYNLLGNALLETKRFDEALLNYKKAAELLPTFGGYHFNVGLAYFNQGKFVEAIDAFEAALKITGNERQSRYYLSKSYTSVGRYRDAVDSWTKFLEVVPDGPEALGYRGWNYLYVGNSGQLAAADSQRYLKLYGWKDQVAPYHVIVGFVGYRTAGMDAEAQSLLAEGTKRLVPDRWPFPIVRFLNGELTADELLGLTINNDQRTEAKTYVGIDMRLKGKYDEAKKQFEWVRDYGNRSFTEYPLAIAEISRLPK